MKKFLVFFAMASVLFTAWALYNSGVVFSQFKEVSLKGVLKYSNENCSILNDFGILDGVDRSFCRAHFDKIGCNISVRGTRTDGEIIGQDCTNRLCFNNLNSENFECKNERIVCSDLIEYNDPYNCACEAPLDCNDSDCSSYEEQILKLRQDIEAKIQPSACPNGVGSLTVADCDEGFILEIDRGETIGFKRVFFDSDKKMVGQYLLSDYGEFCGRSTMKKKIGKTFECLNRETHLICGDSEE